MSEKTLIEWADSTVNGTTGCDGCELWPGPCYAGHYHETRMARALPALYAPDFTEVRLAPGRMAKTASWSDLMGKARPTKPWLDGMPRMIFVGDMGDLFSKAVPFVYIRDEVVVVATSPKGRRHIYMLLTKQPSRMAAFGEWLTNQGIEWPANLWAGASITSNKTVKRAEHLKRVPATVRFLSLEPLWERVDLAGPLNICWHCRGDAAVDGPDRACANCGGSHGKSGISLVIVGGQSDQGQHEAKPFDVQWAREAIRECRIAGTKCFIKQLGSKPYDSARRISIDGPHSHAVGLDLRDSHGGDWSEWSEDLRVREFPALQEVAS